MGNKIRFVFQTIIQLSTFFNMHKIFPVFLKNKTKVNNSLDVFEYPCINQVLQKEQNQ